MTPKVQALYDEVHDDGSVGARVSVSPYGGIVVNLRNDSRSWHIRVWAPTEDDAIEAARAAWGELR